MSDEVDDKGRPITHWSHQEKKPRHIPWDVVGYTKPSWFKKGWASPKMTQSEVNSKRNFNRDPNHPTFNQRFALLRWQGIRIHLIGSDPDGHQIISIRKGQGEPIYLKVTATRIEVWRAGKKLS